MFGSEDSQEGSTLQIQSQLDNSGATAAEDPADIFYVDDDRGPITPTGSISETSNSNTRKRPSTFANVVPCLIDNKRRHLEKALSSAQRDQVFLDEAKEDKEIRRDLGNAVRDSSAAFNNALANIGTSMTR